MTKIDPTIIQPLDTINFAVALHELMTEVGIERFTKPHPLRDLLDALVAPSEKAFGADD